MSGAFTGRTALWIDILGLGKRDGTVDAYDLGGKGTTSSCPVIELAVAPVRIKLVVVVRLSDARLEILEKLNDFAKDMPDENVSMWLLYACTVKKGKTGLVTLLPGKEGEKQGWTLLNALPKTL